MRAAVRVCLVAGLSLAACGAPAPESRRAVPEVGTAEMEPLVADAIREARRAVLDEPDSAESWGRLGMTLHAHELIAPAFECYRVAVELDPASLRWSYFAALAAGTSDLRVALDYFERAAAHEPDFHAFHVRYGEALVRAGDADGARQRYERALELDGTSTHALCGLGQIDLARGDVESARRQLERAATLAPGDATVHRLLSQVYRRLGDDPRAERESLIAGSASSSGMADPLYAELQALSVSVQRLLSQGERLAKKGRLAEAQQEFGRALDIEPSATAYTHLGAALHLQGKLEQAVGAYRSALELNPEEAEAHRQLALALADLGRTGEAEEHARRALAVDPGSVQAHHTLGLVREKQGDIAGALAAFMRALEVEPANGTVRNDLGKTLSSLGREEEAIAQWRLAVSLDPGALLAWYNLGLALAARGEHAASVEAFEQSYRLAPLKSRMVAALAWELATAPDDGVRDGGRALALAAMLREQLPDDPQIADVWAAALAETGRFEEAAAAAGRAARLALDRGRGDEARGLEARQRLYAAGRPFRQAR